MGWRLLGLVELKPELVVGRLSWQLEIKCEVVIRDGCMYRAEH